MQVTDFIALGICPKQIVIDTETYTAKSKNGFILYVLTDCTFEHLYLTFNDRGGNADYGGLTLIAGQWLPGVKEFSLVSGYVLIVDPK